MRKCEPAPGQDLTDPNRGHSSGLWHTVQMVDQIDIYRSASRMIRQHGSEANIHAAMRADELLEAGDLEGAAVWRQVVNAIQELQRGARPGEAIN